MEKGKASTKEGGTSMESGLQISKVTLSSLSISVLVETPPRFKRSSRNPELKDRFQEGHM